MAEAITARQNARRIAPRSAEGRDLLYVVEGIMPGDPGQVVGMRRRRLRPFPLVGHNRMVHPNARTAHAFGYLGFPLYGCNRAR